MRCKGGLIDELNARLLHFLKHGIDRAAYVDTATGIKPNTHLKAM